MYWDGTPQDALLDGNKLDKYNDSSKSFGRLVTFYNLGPGSTCNGTKNTPNLLADIFGDWREELILYNITDTETYLGIYTTNIPTKYTVPTLMHDHTYRMAVCWQNVAYNQPPHLGYNLAEYIALNAQGTNPTGIRHQPSDIILQTSVYDLSGHQLPVSSIDQLPRGIYLVKRKTTDGVVISKLMKD